MTHVIAIVDGFGLGGNTLADMFVKKIEGAQICLSVYFIGFLEGVVVFQVKSQADLDTLEESNVDFKLVCVRRDDYKPSIELKVSDPNAVIRFKKITELPHKIERCSRLLIPNC